MRKLIDFWIQCLSAQPLLSFSLLFVLVASGIFVAFQNEIEAFPELTNIQVQVITQYPRKAAEEIETQVTIPLEIATTSVPGLINQRSISIFGLSVITLTFDDNVSGRQARLDVGQRLNDVSLPDNVKPSLSPDSTPVGEIYRFILSGPIPPGELRLIEDWTVERALKSIPGVADVVTFGGPQQSIDVKIDPAKLKILGLNYDGIAQNIGQNHMNAGGGMLTHGDENYLVRSIGLLEKWTDLNNSVIVTSKNTPIRISDIGEVALGNKQRLGQVGYNKDDDAIEGIVLLRQGSETLLTCEKIREKIKYLNEQVLPKGTQLKAVYDRTDLISQSTHTVLHNVIFGIVLVCLILFIGFGFEFWMMTLSVVLIIPFALIIAFVGLKYFGYKANLISLGAIDFGIIVETAIFACEALIYNATTRDRKNDHTKSQVLVEVFGPALLCAALLLVAFIPILSLQRVEGRIFKPLGVTLVCALIGGQIGAFIFIPLFSRYLPQIQSHKNKFDFFVERIGKSCTSFIERIKNIQFLTRSSFVILTLIIGILVMSLGREFLPQLNEGALYIRATAPPTISKESAVQLASEIRTSISQIPEVIHVVSQIGRPDDGTDVNGFNNIEVLVALKPSSKWSSANSIKGFTEIAQQKLRHIQGVNFNFSQPIKDNVDEAISGVKGELVIKIFGPQIDKLQSLAEEIKAVLTQIPGAEDVDYEELKGQPELRFKMNHERLSRFGVRSADAESALESALQGKVAGQFIDPAGRQIDIVVKAKLPKVLDTSLLRALPVVGADGTKVALGEVVNINLVEGVGRIYREDGLRRIAVKCSVRNRAVVDFVRDASKMIEQKIKMPENFRTHWSGSFENANRATAQLILIVPVCIFVLIILLFTWFQSWKLVGYVLWEVPFAILGSLLFLKLFALNLSISAACGIIVVIGVSFLTGIMLVSEVDRQANVFLGLKMKLKSIIMSSAVATISLIPAALSTSIGSETARPFAVSILGGLVTSFFLSILLLPAIIIRREKQNEKSVS